MKTIPKYVVCVENEGDEISLVLGKVYRVVPPEKNDPPDSIRVIDESAEDYLFSKKWFVPLKVSAKSMDAVDAAIAAGLAAK